MRILKNKSLNDQASIKASKKNPDFGGANEKEPSKRKKKINYYFNFDYSKINKQPSNYLNYTSITQKNLSINSPTNMNIVEHAKKSPSMTKMKIKSRK